METKPRFKPSIFISPHQKDSLVYCPACGHVMEKVLHTPKNIKEIFQCPRCKTYIPKQVFSLSDLK